MFPVIEVLVTFLIGFVLGCLAADMALKKKTGIGIQEHLALGMGRESHSKKETVVKKDNNVKETV